MSTTQYLEWPPKNMAERDHGDCTDTETTYAGRPAILHECPPCPHGSKRGGAYTLHGDPEMDAAQRRLKLMAIDGLTCEHGLHEGGQGSA